MSTENQDYERIEENCPPEHVELSESGVDNSDGSKMDVHQIPNRSVDWDRFTNFNAQFLARVLYSLLQKVGEPHLKAGEDPKLDASFIPYEVGNTPEYDDPEQDTFESGKSGDPNLTHTIGIGRTFFSNGVTHHDVLVIFDRVLTEMTHRVGIPFSDPNSPGASGNNFKDTYKYGSTTEDGKGIGETAPESPQFYDKNDSVTEAVAKVSYYVEQLFKEKIESHADNSNDDPVDWYAGKVHADKAWSSEYTQAQIQRLIEDLGMDAIDYSGFMDPEEIQVNYSQQKDYKVWSAARSAFETNKLWQRTRQALVRVAQLIAKLSQGGGGGGGGLNPFGNDAFHIFSSKFEAALNIETNGKEIEIDFMDAIKPGITDEDRNRQVIILDIAERPAKVAFWSRWLWAFVTGRVTQDLLSQLQNNYGLWDAQGGFGFWVIGQSNGWASMNTSYTNAYPAMAGMSWQDFKDFFMFDGSADEYIAANWDISKLNDYTGPGNLPSTDRGYWNVSGTTANHPGPEWGTVDQSSIVPSGGVEGLSQQQMAHMPSEPVTRAEFTYDPEADPIWIHNSVSGSTANSGNTYLPSGKAKFSIDTTLVGFSGYAKPFTLSETPFQVLFTIDKTVGEDLSDFFFTPEDIQAYIIDGASLPERTIPSAFAAKFTPEVQGLIEDDS
jgi:hypothetical protein